MGLPSGFSHSIRLLGMISLLTPGEDPSGALLGLFNAAVLSSAVESRR
jgi:hypothetical protein